MIVVMMMIGMMLMKIGTLTALLSVCNNNSLEQNLSKCASYVTEIKFNALQSDRKLDNNVELTGVNTETAVAVSGWGTATTETSVKVLTHSV